MEQLISQDYYSILEKYVIERNWEFEDQSSVNNNYGNNRTIRDRYLLVEVKYRLPENLIMDRNLINQQIMERKMNSCDVQLESTSNRICTIVYRINERDF